MAPTLTIPEMALHMRRLVEGMILDGQLRPVWAEDYNPVRVGSELGWKLAPEAGLLKRIMSMSEGVCSSDSLYREFRSKGHYKTERERAWDYLFHKKGIPVRWSAEKDQAEWLQPRVLTSLSEWLEPPSGHWLTSAQMLRLLAHQALGRRLHLHQRRAAGMPDEGTAANQHLPEDVAGTTSKVRDESVPPPGWVESDRGPGYAYCPSVHVSLADAWRMYDSDHGYAPTQTTDKPSPRVWVSRWSRRAAAHARSGLFRHFAALVEESPTTVSERVRAANLSGELTQIEADFVMLAFFNKKTIPEIADIAKIDCPAVDLQLEQALRKLQALT